MVSKLLRKILSDVAMWSFEKINNKAQRIWKTNLKMGEKLFKSSTKPIPNARTQQINSVVVDIVSTLEQNRKMYTNARIMQPKKIPLGILIFFALTEFTKTLSMKFR